MHFPSDALQRGEYRRREVTAVHSLTAADLCLNLKANDVGQELVLVVDDTPTNIAVVSGILKDSFRTKVATNGEKALAIVNEAEKPDLILLDVMMPGMNGYEVCRRLKDIPATRDIPDHFSHGQD